MTCGSSWARDLVVPQQQPEAQQWQHQILNVLSYKRTPSKTFLYLFIYLFYEHCNVYFRFSLGFCFLFFVFFFFAMQAVCGNSWARDWTYSAQQQPEPQWWEHRSLNPLGHQRTLYSVCDLYSLPGYQCHFQSRASNSRRAQVVGRSTFNITTWFYIWKMENNTVLFSWQILGE